MRAAFGAAYSEPDALRCALAYYRALPETGRQLVEAAATARLTVPTVTVLCDDLTGHLIADCGHI